MKKLLFVIAAVAAMVSCNKETSPETTFPSEKGEHTVSLSFHNADTRAASATATTWEKSINKVAIFVFTATGQQILRLDDVTGAQISSSVTTPISLVLPNVAVGDNCDFYVIANKDVANTVNTKTALLALLESDAAAYNGVYADVTTKATRAGGFVMEGMATVPIVAGTTTVAVTLKRPIAKVNLTCQKTAAFTAKYGSADIIVKNVVLNRAAGQSYLVNQAPTKYAANPTPFTHTQVPTKATTAYSNLFYIFEKAASAVGSRVLLTINAIYDADGNTTTTTDQSNVVYEVELSGTTGGQILRNGCYEFIANINGLTGLDVNMSVTVADWETLSTETGNVGQ